MLYEVITIIKTIEENHIDFGNDLAVIKKGRVSRIDTHNGLKDFFMPSTKLREQFESNGYEVKLLITDINKISELFEISQKDLQLLCSIERPVITSYSIHYTKLYEYLFR